MTTRNLNSSIIETLPEPYVVLGRDQQCLTANSSLASLLGYSVDQLIGRSTKVFWPDADRILWQSREFPTEFRTQSGETVAVKVAAFAGEALVIRVLASFSENEVTRVFHVQRLETLGMLAGGVAHDFNNVLTGILGHLAYLESILPGSGPHVESLRAIEDGAIRASSMTQQIVNFSRLQPSEPSARVDVIEVISRVCSLIRGAIPPEIELRWFPPSSSVRIIASEAYLCQVLINLVVNSRDAIQGSGVINVEFEPSCSSAVVRDLFGDEPPSSVYGSLIVTDNGEGMDDEVKSRLFEPYFTTKLNGGTGLGLATVNSIVRSLGGAITVDSSPGNGCCFTVTFPVVEDQVPSTEAIDDDEIGPIRGNGERILVVDDEYAVRNVLGLSLSHLGYIVDTAASGLEALEKYGEASGNFDLVILDLLMPGLSGEEVFNRLLRLNSSVRVLIVSGFSSEQVVRRMLEGGGKDFIQKPFSIEILSHKVQRCLRD